MSIVWIYSKRFKIPTSAYSSKTFSSLLNFYFPLLLRLLLPFSIFLLFSIFFSSFSGPNPTPNTRKFFKKQCDDLGRYQMPEEEILKKRAKLDESFIAATNPELSSGKKSRRSSVSTPNLPNRNVATPVREKW